MENFVSTSLEYMNLTDWRDMNSSMGFHCWVILPIALPVLCLAICGLLSLIKTGQVAPVYIINLLISDVLQICVKPIVFTLSSGIAYELLAFVYSSSLIACVGFMVCISGERYAMIAHPLWYRFHRTIRRSVLYSLLVWLTAFVMIGGMMLAAAASVVDLSNFASCLAIVHLLPYPLVMLFFVGTWRALSQSKSVSTREKRNIMGTLALVLFTYTVFFLPYIILMLSLQLMPELMKDSVFRRFIVMCNTLLSLNPMADPILYVLMRDRSLLILPCCRRRKHLQGQSELFLAQRTATSHGEADI